MFKFLRKSKKLEKDKDNDKDLKIKNDFAQIKKKEETLKSEKKFNLENYGTYASDEKIRDRLKKIYPLDEVDRKIIKKMIKKNKVHIEYASDNNYKKFGVGATNLEIRYMLNLKTIKRNIKVKNLAKTKKQKKLDFIESERERLKAIEDKMVRNKLLEKQKEYSEFFNLVFPSQQLKADKVSYHLFDKVGWSFETKQKNGEYTAVRPCPKVCTSSLGSPKFLYNRMGIRALTLADKKKLEEYHCPYGVGYHLRTKDPRNYF